MQTRQPPRLSVTPMIDWTDRHCRGFHRLISREVRLDTEKTAAPALIHGGPVRLPDPAGAARTVLQLGGDEPAELAQAVRLVAPWGYAGISLDIDCPGARVQSCCFGAALMHDPARVAACLPGRRSALLHGQPGEIDPSLPPSSVIDREISLPASWIADFRTRQETAA